MDIKHLTELLPYWKKNILHKQFFYFSDSITPIQVFQICKTQFSHAQLLESVELNENWGRHTYIALGALIQGQTWQQNTQLSLFEQQFQLLQTNPCSIVDWLQSKMDPSLSIPALGYFGFSLVHFFEHLPFPAADANGIDMPDCNFLFPEILLTYDHAYQKLRVDVWSVDKHKQDSLVQQVHRCLRQPSGLIPLQDPLQSSDLHSLPLPEFTSNTTKAEFERLVVQAKRYIRAGDVFQVVLSQRLQTEFHADPFLFYRYLRVLNPSPYMYYLQYPNFTAAGSSPEMLVKRDGANLTLRPIAGTRKRGRTAAEDLSLAEELLTDEKELAEHYMLVDLGRNDLGRISKFGSVRVSDALKIENYSHVKHIVSTITSNAADNLSMEQLFHAVFPAGTLSGAPKIRAMEIILELEKCKRDFYGGSVWMAYQQNINACIGIRSAIFSNQKAYVQAGAGIVFDSVPEVEYEESYNKAKAVLHALALASANDA